MTYLPYPKIGDRVKIIQKKNYVTGELTEGIVKDILTKKRNHPRGTKVRLENGIVGRVQEFVHCNAEGDQSGATELKIDYFEDDEALV